MNLASASATMPGFLAIAIALSSPAAAEQFSVRCERDGYYFLTFDTEKRRFVYEAPGGPAYPQGPMYKGHITSITDNEIQMQVLMGGPLPPPVTWDRRRGTLQSIADAAAGREPSFINCAPVELRPALAWFDKLYPHE